MRFIILKTENNQDGTITFFGASETVRRSSGSTIKWIDLREAKTNTIDPSSCDLLSFADREEASSLLEELEIDNEDIAIIGIDVD